MVVVVVVRNHNIVGPMVDSNFRLILAMGVEVVLVGVIFSNNSLVEWAVSEVRSERCGTQPEPAGRGESSGNPAGLLRLIRKKENGAPVSPISLPHFGNGGMPQQNYACLVLFRKNTANPKLATNKATEVGSGTALKVRSTLLEPS